MVLSRNVRGRRAWTAGLVLAAVCAAAVLISLNTGTIRLSPLAVLRTFLGQGSADEVMVLFDFRLPRIVVTLLAGAALGVSGAMLQGLSRNALADPGILGLHAGAGFGLLIYVTFFQALQGPVALWIPLFTFAGGASAAALILLLAYDRHKGLAPVRMILIGIAVAAGLSAVMLFMSLRLDDTVYAFTSRWLLGSVWGRDWIHAGALLPWVVVLVPYALSQARSLNAFSLGDELAVGIGTAVRTKRILLLTAAVGLSSAAVAMVGGVGFIGLAAPHLARRLVGPMYQHVLPVACMIGLVILVVSDTIGRSLFQPNAIPAGVVVAAVGAPYFLYLLLRTK